MLGFPEVRGSLAVTFDPTGLRCQISGNMNGFRKRESELHDCEFSPGSRASGHNSNSNMLSSPFCITQAGRILHGRIAARVPSLRLKMRRPASKNKYPVKSLAKALHILDVLAERPAGFGITELSEALHIGKSTVHRLLATLKEEGYVVTHPAGSRYILGGRIARLGQQLSDQYQLLTFGVPVIHRWPGSTMRRLTWRFSKEPKLCTLLEKRAGRLCAIIFSWDRVHPRTPQPSAKCVYRALAPEEIRRRYKGVKLTPLGPKTIKTFSGLLEELSAVREAGFAYDDEESGPGIYCIAVPVRLFPGGPRWALVSPCPNQDNSCAPFDHAKCAAAGQRPNLAPTWIPGGELAPYWREFAAAFRQASEIAEMFN